MNRTPRPVAGSRRKAVANAYAAARRIEAAQVKARQHATTVSAVAQIAAARVKPKGPKRDSRGRFVKA
jgi:hypothetical protein